MLVWTRQWILVTNILDGSKSNDPDGKIESYTWRQISGEKTKSRFWNQPMINVATTSLIEDTLMFELLVTDKYNSGVDTVYIYVVDIPEPLILQTSSSSANEGKGMAKISLVYLLNQEKSLNT